MARPLTPAVFHILVSLADGPLHGYAIMKRVDTESAGRVNMGPGTLYGSLKRMIDADLVLEAAADVHEDERRIRYELTAAGHVALAAELERYRDVVARTAGTVVPRLRHAE
mgnify:FL=1